MFLNKRYKIILCMLLLGAALLSGCGSEDKVAALRQQALELYAAGDYAGAEAGLDKALEAGWGRASDIQVDILRYRAECELMQGKFAEAKSSYEALLKADTAKEAADMYASVISELSDLDELSAMVTDMEAGDYETAYEAASVYASLEGSMVGRLSWFNKAVCAEHLGNYEEAYELFNEYLKVYPEDAEAKKELDFLRTR